MAIDNKDKVLKVPNLRFPEFTEEWKETKIGDITSKVGSGVTPKGGSAVYKTSGHLFIRSQNVGNGCFLLDDVAYIDEATHKKQINTELKDGDVLLNITGASIGRTTVVNKNVEGGNVNQHVCIIRLLEDYSPNYICNYLLSYGGQKQIDSFQAGGNREGLNFEQIRSIKFFIPSFREQSKIASLLSLLEERIATQNKIIEDLKKLKVAISNKLFELLNQVEYKISDVAQIGRGRVISTLEISKQECPTYPVYSSQTSNNGIMGYLDTYDFEGEYITWTTDGANAGTVFYRNGKFNCTNVCGVLKVNDNIDAYYLSIVLQSATAKYVSTNLANPKLMNNTMSSIKVKLPSLPVQRNWSNTLREIDAKIENEILASNLLCIQKQYLLQQMFI